MTNFEGVVPALGQALSKRGYEELTAVQQAILADDVQGADALVSAQTGSGKTVAFGLSMAPTLLQGADRLEDADTPLALVVAPTRELAMQVKRELEWLYEPTGAALASCVGGMDMRRERWALQQGAHIVVGTPGRLRDHIERGSLDMSQVRVVVLDEADEMLDLGFREDLEFILKTSPEDRQTLLFSATVPKPIAVLAQRYQRNAVRIAATQNREQHGDIDYQALLCAPSDQENAIINVLRHSDSASIIIFCGTRATVNHLTSRFTNRGISVVPLSGELNQSARTHALQALRDGRARVCIATDVAARGIDLPNLDLVIHADLPKNPASLLHRSGRTGRAGRKGISTLIVPYPRRRHMERLLANANVTASWGKPPSAEEILAKDRARILEDEALIAEANDEESAFADDLLAKFDPKTIAVGFLRKGMAGLTAPEELLDEPPERSRDNRRERSPRDKRERSAPSASVSGNRDFENGVWVRLNVGQKHKAEARWLLPMLCRAGKITKQDIGAIRIQEAVTLVEIHSDAAENFLAEVGPSRKIEKSVTVDRLAEAPNLEETPTRARKFKRERSSDLQEDRPRREPRPKREKSKPAQRESATFAEVAPTPPPPPPAPTEPGQRPLKRRRKADAEASAPPSRKKTSKPKQRSEAPTKPKRPKKTSHRKGPSRK